VSDRKPYEASLTIRFSYEGDLAAADKDVRNIEAFIASHLTGAYWGDVTATVDTVRMGTGYISNARTIEGHTLDWALDENGSGSIGVWLDNDDPIGSVWMTDSEKWMAETHFGGGFSAECDTFDAAVDALFAHAVGGGA
jgi:hypothetical protein